MPVSEWSYKAQGTGVRHLGPMAQDFHAAFGSAKTIVISRLSMRKGVALAAIKAFRAENDAKDRKIADLRSAAEARFAALEKRLAALESRLATSSTH